MIIMQPQITKNVEKYIIGVDAGGSQTKANAYTQDGEFLFGTKGGFGNVTIDFDISIHNIKATIDAIIDHLGNDYAFICLGCAGIETGKKINITRNFLEQIYGANTYVTNDANLALYGALKGQDGILVVAGTGSIGYLKLRGECKRYGGWGHLIGDDGSGYSIAMNAIRHITTLKDKELPLDTLGQEIFSRLDLSGNNELIDFVYNSTKSDIASIVPIVVMKAYQEDGVSIDLLTEAGEKLADLAVNLATQNSIDNPTIAVSGSIIGKINLVFDSFKLSLDKNLKAYKLLSEEFDASIGAVYIYKELTKNED
ncbi:MAG: BadF/BadG/BcrA/BcrD ATPase family protein [Oscillospiraceae bacterium]